MTQSDANGCTATDDAATDDAATDDAASGGAASHDAESAAVVLIAAVAENGVIGADGAMPWHYPADLARFRERTMGHPVVMGRKTYESVVADVGGPLPGRTNVVLSTRDLDLPDGAVLAASVDEALEQATAAPGGGTVYVAGGATVYEQLLPRADRMVLTEVPGRPDGDTRFPAWDADAWREVDRERDGDLAFVTYERT